MGGFVVEKPCGPGLLLGFGLLFVLFCFGLGRSGSRSCFLVIFLGFGFGCVFFASSFLAGACAKAKEAANMLATTSANDFIVISNWNENLMPDLPAA